MHLDSIKYRVCRERLARLPELGLASDQSEETRNFCYRDSAGEPLKVSRNRCQGFLIATATVMMMVLMIFRALKMIAAAARPSLCRFDMHKGGLEEGARQH